MVSLARHDPRWLRALLIAVTFLFLGLFLFLPLLSVFTEALRKGLGAYFVSFTDPAARSAISLTLVAGISVPATCVRPGGVVGHRQFQFMARTS